MAATSKPNSVTDKIAVEQIEVKPRAGGSVLADAIVKSGKPAAQVKRKKDEEDELQNLKDDVGATAEEVAGGLVDGQEGPMLLAQAETSGAAESASGGGAAGTGTVAGSATGAEASGAAALSDAALGAIILGSFVGVAVIASSGGSSAAAAAAPAGDTTAPTIQSMTAQDSTVVLTYNEALDTTNVPATTDFAVTVGGVANVVTGVVVAGMTVTLTLTSAVATGAAVQVIYTDPTTGNDVNAIQDAAGNDAVSFTTGVVADGYIRGAQIYIDTNNNGVADAGEALTGVVTNANGNFILPAGTPAGVIIATGGVNIDTGVPNTLVLKAPAGSTIVSPLTTLVQAYVAANAGTTVAEASAAVVTSLSLPAGTDLTTYDPIAALAINAVDVNALAVQQAAVQVATVVTLAAAAPAGTTTSADAANAVINNLVTQIGAVTAPVAIDLTAPADITTALGTASTASAATIATATTAIAAATTLTEISTAQAVALDTINPAAPTAVALAAASDTGSSSTDNLTNDSTPAVRVSFNATAIDGTAAVAGDTVTVLNGTTTVGTATLTSTNIANGYVDVTLSAQADGAYTFTATLADIAGNTSVASAASPTITLDTAVPAAPTVVLTSDTGSSSSDGVTSVGTVNVTGVETGASWEYSTDSGASWTAGTGTSFALTGDGDKSAIVRQTDVSGNVSASSTALAFTLDTTIATPTVALTTDSGASGDLITNSAALTVSPDATAVTRTYTVDSGTASGAYTAPTAAGAHTVTVTDTDTAGNTASSTTLTFTLDATAPTLSSSLPADNATGVVGSSIVLTFGEAVAAGTGNIVISDGVTPLNISVTDTTQVAISGNTVTITPAIAPAPATAYTVTLASGVITDVAGNAFAGIASGDLNFTMADLPIVTIAVTNQADNLLNVGDTANITFTLSAASTDFAVGDVTVAGGTLSDFSGSGTTYAATLTPTASSTANATVSVAAGVFTSNSLGNMASSTLTIPVDTVAPAAPTLALASDTGSSGSDGITSVGTVNVTGVETGASWEYSTDSGASWTAGTGTSFALTGDGDKSAIVRQTDVSVNVSASSTALAFTLDTTIATPTVALTTDSGASGDLITNSAALTVSTAATDVTRTYTVDSGTASGTYTAPTAAAQHTVVVTDTDTAGNTASSTTLTFTLDATAPTLSSSLPVDDATGVVGGSIVLTFSEAVVAGTGNITISDGTTPYDIAVGDTTQVVFSGTTVTITPTGGPAPSTTYSVTMASGVIADAAGNAYAGITDATTLNFTTAAVPTITNTATLDGVTNLDVRSDLVLTFSDTIALGSGQIRIMDDMGTNGWTLTNTTTAESKQDVTDNDVVITLTNGAVTALTIGGVDKSAEMADSVTVSGNTLVISPAGSDNVSSTDWDFDWDFGANYHIELDAGVVTANGIDNVAIADSTTLNFTTVTPLGDATGAASQMMAADGTLTAGYTWHHGHVSDATANGFAMDFGTGAHALVLQAEGGADTRTTTIGGKVLLSGLGIDDVIYMDNSGDMTITTTDGQKGANYTGSGDSNARLLDNADGGTQLQTVFADYASTTYTAITAFGGGDLMLENSLHYNANLVIFG